MNARFTPLLIGLLLGVAVGLLIGWVIHPVERDATTPVSLQERYQTELILMVAETFTNQIDLDLAHQRLSVLGYKDNEDLVGNALNFAQANDFSDQDVQVLSTFLDQLTTPASTQEIGAP